MQQLGFNENINEPSEDLRQTRTNQFESLK